MKRILPALSYVGSLCAEFALFSFLAFCALRLPRAHAANIPATVTATAAVPVLAQDGYRWYANIDGLDPTAPLAAGNVSVTAPAAGTQLRLRMDVQNAGSAIFPAGNILDLQYANATSGPWTDVGTSTPWAFFDNPSVADGQVIVNLFLGSSTVGESYGESDPSAAMPTDLLAGDVGEWDWSLVNISATTSLPWFFRMENASGTVAQTFANYPTLTATSTSHGGGGGGDGGGNSGGGGGGGGGGVYHIPTATPNASDTATSTASGTLPAAPPLLPPQFEVADFNGDNRVDIVDFSIMLYYYGRSDTAALRYDLNHDGVVDLPDVSILMYYWTET
jgi:uncharacterized membrane protein YgcG